ncbi:trans-sialidase [Trypanosoma cruzi Dm28c]|uniref:Trans-sialidase n=2 Tax=Trypanosoma cruzi TaxID=5693 RepID=V5AUA5_TRYCR|nr:trans-sialidase [Trypanosoma cruzi Dm28c]PBJ78512.1 trans-sialidase [Trypanosoma cruzi cruzi]PWU93421.1 putative trans-sialidase, Group V [Trypanosoma cruzi]
MLSRVAAVKAPRTHNRRRLTGSSGGRREGRESELQRPNMSRHLFHFVLLLLLVMAFGGSDAAGVEESAVPQFKWKGITDDEKLDSLGAPSLLKVGNDVFAVAEAQCKEDGGNSFTGIASQLLTTQISKTPAEVLEKPEDQTQVLERDGSESQNKRVDVSRPTTAVKGNDIYMLVGVYISKVAVPRQDAKPDATQLGLLLVKGSVSSVEDPSSKKIGWKDTESSPQKLFEAQLDSWTRLIGSGGSGVKMEDETLVFPVEGTKKTVGDAEEEGKTVSLIIYSTDNKNWKLSKGMSADGCGSPSVVEWEGKLMMMTACDGGPRRVYEIDDKEEWTEALGTLSRVWGYKKDVSVVRSGFITATVGNDGDNKKVMLVTLPVYAEEGNENEKGKLHLWLTDNTHIVDIGSVSDDDAAASSLLYKSGTGEDKKEELIALYEKKKGDDEGKPSPGMVSVLLTEQLERVKEVLAAWKKADDRVSNLCATLLAQKDRSTANACGAVKITDGLVAFLSGKFSDGIWRDEYLGVNATIAENDGAVKAENGVKFTGRGAGAQWPVGKQGENQLYHFANYNFTLVATVSIHNVPEGSPIPVMGVRAGKEGKTKLIELSYNSGKKWQVLCGDENSKEHSSGWEKETQYQVVIMLKNGTQCTVYVDGQRVGDAQCELGSGESNDVSHFYIGGDGGSAENKESRGEVSVTVTNVLLYNRPLDEAEINALNPNKASTPSPVDRPEGDEIQPSGGGTEEQRQSLGSSGAGGASTTAVSTITTPSAGEESVMQVVSGSSSDGHKNVGGGSFSDGDPRVETREGGTNGQEEEVNTQVREVNATAVSSSLGNVSQENNSDAGTVCESGLLPSLLLLLLGLWGFAAL